MCKWGRRRGELQPSPNYSRRRRKKGAGRGRVLVIGDSPNLKVPRGGSGEKIQNVGGENTRLAKVKVWLEKIEGKGVWGGDHK